jgi:hypothetical protein
MERFPEHRMLSPKVKGGSADILGPFPSGMPQEGRRLRPGDLGIEELVLFGILEA